MAELNRAVAELDGPEVALAIVERLNMGGYQYAHPTRAELLRRLGRGSEALDAYRRAFQLAEAEHERRFLQRRIAELGSQ